MEHRVRLLEKMLRTQKIEIGVASQELTNQQELLEQIRQRELSYDEYISSIEESIRGSRNSPLNVEGLVNSAHYLHQLRQEVAVVRQQRQQQNRATEQARITLSEQQLREKNLLGKHAELEIECHKALDEKASKIIEDLCVQRYLEEMDHS